VANGTKAAVNAFGAIPGVGGAVGAIDQWMGAGGFGAKAGLTAAGAPSETVDAVPQSVADLAAGAAVYGTNVLFGADEDPGDGNRRDEVGSGLTAAASAVFAPAALAASFPEMRDDMIDWFGDTAGDVFGIAEDAPTSGAKSSPYAQAGQEADPHVPGIFDEMFGD
jgi:hypothetical protein